jgi:hypothetical protein
MNADYDGRKGKTGVSGYRKRESFDLERQLRAARPQPGRDFLQSVMSEVRGRRQSPQSFRLAFAGGLTVMLFAALAAVGGIGYAAAAPAQAVKAVVAAVSNDNGPTLIQQSPACDQYVAKANSGRGNLSETSSGPRSTDSSTLINPHLGNTALGPGDFPTDDCDPGNSGAVNRGGD